MAENKVPLKQALESQEWLTPELEDEFDKSGGKVEINIIPEKKTGKLFFREVIGMIVSIAKLVVPLIASEQKEEKEMFDRDLQKKVQGYINSFRNEIGQYLRRDIGQEFNIVSFPAGVLLEIKYGPSIPNSDNFIGEVSNIEKAFNTVSRKLEEYLTGKELTDHKAAFDQNKRYFERGTEILFGNGILIIAGKDDLYWSQENAKSDVNAVMGHMSKRQQELGITTKPKRK